MTDPRREAKATQKKLLAELDREVKDLRGRLDREEPVPISDIKSWRRGWIDRAVAIRKLAKQAQADDQDDEADKIKELAEQLEERARDQESDLIDIARDLEQARGRGGVLTPQERAARASGDRRSAEGVAAAALAGTDALRREYLSQLELEKQGIQMVIEAGRGRTEEFEHAMDDASTRLERIWQKIRTFGNQAAERLSDLDTDDPQDEVDDAADQLRERVDDTVEQLLEKLDSLKRSVMDAVERDAQVRARTPAADSFTVGVQQQVDKTMETLRPMEEEYRHWQQACITDSSVGNLEKLEAAARAMYDKQLFYIADLQKRKLAVERYVAQALKEVSPSRDEVSARPAETGEASAPQETEAAAEAVVESDVEEPAAPEAEYVKPDEVETKPSAPLSAGGVLEEEPPRDVKSVCRTLFDRNVSSLDASRLFEERYRGRTVRWSGTLVKVETYSFDFIFGNEPGTKAVLEVHELEGDYGDRRVVAILQLPAESHGGLEGAKGRPLDFEGRFLKVDVFLRRLYVAEGRML